jgi:endonuclease IV
MNLAREPGSDIFDFSVEFLQEEIARVRNMKAQKVIRNAGGKLSFKKMQVLSNFA